MIFQNTVRLSLPVETAHTQDDPTIGLHVQGRGDETVNILRAKVQDRVSGQMKLHCVKYTFPQRHVAECPLEVWSDGLQPAGGEQTAL